MAALAECEGINITAFALSQALHLRFRQMSATSSRRAQSKFPAAGKAMWRNGSASSRAVNQIATIYPAKLA
jgi:hypothetical protein